MQIVSERKIMHPVECREQIAKQGKRISKSRHIKKFLESSAT